MTSIMQYTADSGWSITWGGWYKRRNV